MLRADGTPDLTGGLGIAGRKINYIIYDDGFVPAKTLEQTRKLLEQDEVAFLFAGRLSFHSKANTAPLYQALHDYGADILLAGHWHNYERLDPADAAGTADVNFGIRTFIVGTGGIPLTGFGTTHGVSAVRNAATHGVMKFTLNDNGYDWQFIPIAGQTFTDAGTSAVHGPPSGNAAPVVSAGGDQSVTSGTATLTGRTLTYTPTVAEIGSGWGALGTFLARNYGVKVVSVTLSPEQCGVAKQRAIDLVARSVECDWLNSNRLKTLFPCLNDRRYSRNRSACSNSRDENINFTSSVLPDFFRRSQTMNLRVGWIVELLGNPRPWYGSCKLFRLSDGPFHA